MKTLFDDMFDFNNDGKLDWLEKGARDAFILSMIDEEEKKEESESDRDDDDEW